MARKARDYRLEYERRIAEGRAKGKTRQQARGHAAERKGAVVASREGMSQRQVMGYLSRLADRRIAVVWATTADGERHQIGRGGVRSLEKWFRSEDGLLEQLERYHGEVVSIQVVWQ